MTRLPARLLKTGVYFSDNNSKHLQSLNISKAGKLKAFLKKKKVSEQMFLIGD